MTAADVHVLRELQCQLGWGKRCQLKRAVRAVSHAADGAATTQCEFVGPGFDARSFRKVPERDRYQSNRRLGYELRTLEFSEAVDDHMRGIRNLVKALTTTMTLTPSELICAVDISLHERLRPCAEVSVRLEPFCTYLCTPAALKRI